MAIVAGRDCRLLTAGLVDTPAATASLLLNMELVATVVLAATLFREHLGGNMIAAAVLVTGAGVLLVWEPGASVSLGALLIVGACACWGLDNSVTSQIDQVSPQHVVFLKGTVAGSVNLALGLVITRAGHVNGWSIVGALTVGALGYGASITLWPSPLGAAVAVNSVYGLGRAVGLDRAVQVIAMSTPSASGCRCVPLPAPTT